MACYVMKKKMYQCLKAKNILQLTRFYFVVTLTHECGHEVLTSQHQLIIGIDRKITCIHAYTFITFSFYSLHRQELHPGLFVLCKCWQQWRAAVWAVSASLKGRGEGLFLLHYLSATARKQLMLHSIAGVSQPFFEGACRLGLFQTWFIYLFLPVSGENKTCTIFP